ncbi:hypothetical protein PCANC_22242 [Puccinia coronata f. sp. avenae]|uniref:Protein ARV n=1 Tax=Puccinia coronata f. sp. avenae TaxID=200324 RepID=A0A2N5SF91_9BASI|nr:hypothetical protein PCANC_22242 [Puccinia coronata f. sp. avenae]
MDGRYADNSASHAEQSEAHRAAMCSNRCVTCGVPAKYLFTEYGHDNFVLEICSKCKRFIDPYIEQSSILLVLDLFLLKPQVYSHLLFNLNYAFQSFHSQTPAHPKQGHASKKKKSRKSASAIQPRRNRITRFHSKSPLLICSLILILESCLQALDDLHPDDPFLQSKPVTRVLTKLSGLVFHIFSLVLTATIIARLKYGQTRHGRSNLSKKDILNAIQGIIISFFPGIVLCFTIIIFQNSYGTRSPPPLFSPAQNVHLSQFMSWVARQTGYDISEIFDGLVGIDMDQLGSTKMKQFLIRNLMGSLSSSIGISVAFDQPWAFGFAVLSCCSLQKRLLLHILHGIPILLPN